MNKNIKYEYLLGQSMCTIKYKGNEFIGIANCHPDDMDFVSERTGCYIAETRANLARLRHKRDNNLRPQVKSLMNFYKDLKGRKHFNQEHPVVGVLIQHINELNHELAEIEQDIRLEQTYLNDYIKNKDIIYKKIRKANTQ